jgi:D-alanyl-D-alanine carboxypeptidase
MRTAAWVLITRACLPEVAGAQPAAPPIREVRRLVDSIGRAAVSDGRITGLSVAVSRGGSPWITAQFGRSADASAPPLHSGSVFRIASITKQFTAAAILHLVDRGRVALDDPLSRWVDDWPADRPPVTVRQLLTHTAGLREVRFSGTARTPQLGATRTRQDTIAAFITADSSEFAAGTVFRYSNAGYFMLGRVVERASGISLSAYWTRHFFRPLQMQQTSDCDRVPARASRVMGDERDTAERAHPSTPIRMQDVFAAGAICSTASDLLRWRAALERGTVISRRLYDAMHDSSSTRGIGPAYGFGVFLGTIYGRPWSAHNGSINGFASRLASYPRDQLTVAVLANTGGANVTPIEHAIARAALGVPDPAPLDLTVSATDGARYVGTYRDDEHGLVATVRYERGRIIARLWQMGTTALLHQGSGVFALAIDHDFCVSFRNMSSGKTAMDVTDGVQGTTLIGVDSRASQLPP